MSNPTFLLTSTRKLTLRVLTPGMIVARVPRQTFVHIETVKAISLPPSFTGANVACLMRSLIHQRRAIGICVARCFFACVNQRTVVSLAAKNQELGIF